MSQSSTRTYEVEVTLHEQGTALVEAETAQEAAEKCRSLQWDSFDLTGHVRAGVRSVRLAR